MVLQDFYIKLRNEVSQGDSSPVTVGRGTWVETQLPLPLPSKGPTKQPHIPPSDLVQLAATVFLPSCYAHPITHDDPMCASRRGSWRAW